MKSMFTMGFRNSFFDQPAMGAFPDFTLPELTLPDFSDFSLPAAAAEPAPSPAPSPAPVPTQEFFPVNVPYYYPPARPVYQVQAPAPAPVTTVVKTEGVPPAVYYVGGAALLLGLVALVARA